MYDPHKQKQKELVHHLENTLLAEKANIPKKGINSQSRSMSGSPLIMTGHKLLLQQ